MVHVFRAETKHLPFDAEVSRLADAQYGVFSREQLSALRASLDGKARRYRQILDRLETEEDPSPAAAPGSPGTSGYEAALHARRAVIDAQREELLRWRDAGHLPDASLRILERELDHEERTLPPHDGH